MKKENIITNSDIRYHIKHATEMKRVMLIVAIALMLAGSVLLFVSCDGGGGDSSISSSDTSDTQTDGPPDAPPGDMGGDSGDINKTGVYEQNGGTVEEDGMTYAATQTDQSSVYVYGGGTYALSNSTLTKTGDSSSVNDSNFYGNNAIVLAEGASTINLDNCE